MNPVHSANTLFSGILSSTKTSLSAGFLLPFCFIPSNIVLCNPNLLGAQLGAFRKAPNYQAPK
jgi:hypothetical protein